MHALTGNIPCNRCIFAFARDFIYFIDKDNSALGSRNIAVGSVNKFQKNVFNIFTYISRFSERRRVGNRKRNLELLRKRFCKKRLS